MAATDFWLAVTVSGVPLQSTVSFSSLTEATEAAVALQAQIADAQVRVMPQSRRSRVIRNALFPIGVQVPVGLGSGAAAP